MAVDWLHTISLGVSQFFIMFIMHQLFSVDAWETGEGSEEARIGPDMYPGSDFPGY